MNQENFPFKQVISFETDCHLIVSFEIGDKGILFGPTVIVHRLHIKKYKKLYIIYSDII